MKTSPGSSITPSVESHTWSNQVPDAAIVPWFWTENEPITESPATTVPDEAENAVGTRSGASAGAVDVVVVVPMTVVDVPSIVVDVATLVDVVVAPAKHVAGAVAPFTTYFFPALKAGVPAKVQQ